MRHTIRVIKKPSLAETHPELAAQADGWDPKTLSRGSGKKVGWKCNRSHTWSATVSSRVNGNQCPVCSNQNVLAGFNDLATTNPELALQADGWDPTTLTAGSNKKVEWKCNRRHVFKSVVHSRALQGTGCPICSNQKLLVGYNDLATTHSELAAHADGWDPTTLIAGTNKKLKWTCKTGHSWIASGNSRTSQGSGCPICANKQVLAGFNDLATTHSELAAQADGWDPTTVIAGNYKKFPWKCSIGHSWVAKLSNRAYLGRNCPICANKQVLTGFNDLTTTH